MKKISVVIPCYNAAEYLDRCMEHLLKQTIGLENIEIILVDDASTDGGATLSLMMEYEKRYPDNIMVIPLQQNLRQGGARNVGILYASGEYLMFCDADDWLVLDAMEILYYIASENDADVVEFQFKEVMKIKEKTAADILEKYMGEADFPTGIEDKMKYVIWEFNEDDKNRKEYMISCGSNYGLGCMNKLYRLHMLQSNHIRFAEHLICEEPSFTLPIRIYEKKHIVVDAELYCYFQSPNSTVRSSWHDKEFDNIKVWMTIVQDFEKRGLFEKYHKELEYMFFGWGFAMSIRMLTARGYTLSEKEMNLFKKMSLRLFPGMCQNSYVIEETDDWSMFMKELLETEVTKENVLELNRLMRISLQKWSEWMSRKR